MLKNAEREEKKKEKINQNKKGKEDEQLNKIPKWKKQSEQFRNILRNARRDDNQDVILTGKGGGGGSSGKQMPQQKAGIDYGTYDDDLILCNICSRRYNENAYNKHLPTCQRKQKEMMMKGGNKGTTTTNTNTTTSKPNLNLKFNKR